MERGRFHEETVVGSEGSQRLFDTGPGNESLQITNLYQGEKEVMGRARAGELTCPCCGQLLSGEWIETEDVSGMLLYCGDTMNCGFREL